MLGSVVAGAVAGSAAAALTASEVTVAILEDDGTRVVESGGWAAHPGFDRVDPGIDA